MITILLIHHCRRIRRHLRLVLLERYEVVAAHSATAAQRLLRNRKPDLVLVGLDGHDGTPSDSIARWRLWHGQTPMVALSKSDASHGATAARRHGAKDVVRWPGPVMRLLHAIARAMASANADRKGAGARKPPYGRATCETTVMQRET